ncbi:NCS2 family permease [Paenibacillus gansuensis]|uniref:NCS2 family permease n=1 Tax=Paenibacillus gansuensis TaxID=306542 RepID=A0ABW5PGD8_9BACL
MFHVKEHGTSIRKEIVAGLTTFLTMAYIMVVNPIILADAGVPFEQSFTATILAAAVGTLFMGLLANYPFAVAPGMGLNAYFAYSVVLAQGGAIDYRIAFSAVFVTGLLLVLLSLTPLRTKLIEVIPRSMKHAITAGIGLFIAFIGLRLSGLIVADPSNLVKLGNLHSPSVVLALTGLLVTLVLLVRNVNGALFIGMVITGIIAYLSGYLWFSNGFVGTPGLPEGLLVWNPVTAVGDVIRYGLYGVVFSFFLVTLFDTTGTLLGLGEQAGFMREGKLPRSGRALFSDSAATLFGSMAGTSPSTAYIESASGVGAGGRTGLTAIVIAVLFGLSAFFGPTIGAIAGISAITSPALIIVGSFMITSVKHIEWDKFHEAFPAFLVILSMPLTSSIGTGIALGFISYPIMKAAKGLWKDIHPLMAILALLFIYQLVFLPH